jgi:hypothetical protein
MSFAVEEVLTAYVIKLVCLLQRKELDPILLYAIKPAFISLDIKIAMT